MIDALARGLGTLGWNAVLLSSTSFFPSRASPLGVHPLPLVCMHELILEDVYDLDRFSNTADSEFSFVVVSRHIGTASRHE